MTAILHRPRRRTTRQRRDIQQQEESNGGGFKGNTRPEARSHSTGTWTLTKLRYAWSHGALGPPLWSTLWSTQREMKSRDTANGPRRSSEESTDISQPGKKCRRRLAHAQLPAFHTMPSVSRSSIRHGGLYKILHATERELHQRGYLARKWGGWYQSGHGTARIEPDRRCLEGLPRDREHRATRR